MAAFGALMMITTVRPPALPMVAWLGAIAALGVVTAIPIKRQLINKEALAFPTGTATAETIRVIHGGGSESAAEGTRQASILTQRITYLADVGAIAPMVGLLGTVLGMIKSFNEIAQDTFIGAGQIQLAGGVSEALITTAAGLVIGIPSLIFYSVFRGGCSA